MAFKFGTKAASALAVAAVLAGAGGLAGCSKPKAPPQGFAVRAQSETRPNVLLILVDHLGPEFGAYGDHSVPTPNLDRLAHEGTLFTQAYAASGSEDAAEAALLTGVSPQTIGAVQEWTGAPGWVVAPPPEVKAFPEMMREAGYTTFHVGARQDPFGSPASLWDQDVREPGGWPAGLMGQPFFGEVELSTLDRAETPKSSKGGLFAGKPKDQKATGPQIDPRALPLPAYLPDSETMRAALKGRYANIARLDAEVGAILARLDKAGLRSTTTVILAAKTGPALPRSERTLYESGVHVPLIVRRADGKGAGAVRRDLVGGADFAPSILKLVGIQPLGWMQGHERFSGSGEAAHYVFSVQNRVDQTFERAFAVRDGRFLYIHNLAFDATQISLARQGAALEAMKAAKKGELSKAQAAMFEDDRPEDELYDLTRDPYQINNLADDGAFAGDVERLSGALNAFAASAPDYSTWSSQDLQDLFKPGGQTPVSAQPTGAMAGGKLTLDTITPGAAVLWRTGGEGPWKLYAGPVPVPAKAEIQAVSSRYGFQQSAPAVFSQKK